MSEEIFFIPFDEKQIADFKEHLEKTNNHKILFSAKFGEGKTTFLKKFFENNEKYEVFHLYPINYQIYSNDDIFELLKYDILIELLNNEKRYIDELKDQGFKEMFDIEEKNYLSFIKENFSMKLFVEKGINYVEIIDAFGIGKLLGRAFKDTLEFDEKFQKYKSGKKGLLNKFIKKMKEKDIMETDIFSQIINDKIKKIKNGKESILILDDLDRMDPEHIFRILNIFSAHFEKTTEEGKPENKFGFNKIILVAHYGNLKEMFKYRYGMNVVPDGYFSKFFSKSIYHFNDLNILKKSIEEIVIKLKIEDENLKSIFNLFLNRILIDLLFNRAGEKLNIRNFDKAFDKILSLEENYLISNAENPIFYVNICLRFMEDVCNQFENNNESNKRLFHEIDRSYEVSFIGNDDVTLKIVMDLIDELINQNFVSDINKEQYNSFLDYYKKFKNNKDYYGRLNQSFKKILVDYIKNENHLKF